MTVGEKIAAMAAVGGTLREVEATLGRRLTDEERAEYDRAVLARKVRAGKARLGKTRWSLADDIELRGIRSRLRTRHATVADIARGREILAKDAEALAQFNEAVTAAAKAKAASDSAADARERKRRQRERDHAFEIPQIADLERRESCRYDLLKFGITYFMPFLLKHEPSELMVASLVRPLQNVILGGGQRVVQFPRGTGKTTWIKIAMIWAVVYGHKRFVVTVAATGPLATAIVRQVRDAFERSRVFAADFPSLCAPIADLAGNWRRASTQTFEGRPTGVEYGGGYFTLPTIFKHGTDEPVEEGAGSVFYAAGIHGALRGLGDESRRPDMILFDDPQTGLEALSREACDKLENLIVSDALGCFGHTDIVSAVMAITPIKLGDIASRFSSRKLHPEWGSSKQPYVLAYSENFDAWLRAFREAYNEDVAVQDAAAARGEVLDVADQYALSDSFYREHREEFIGVSVLDPLNYAPNEEDAIHHVLKIMCRFADMSGFEAEYQMVVNPETAGIPLQPEEVQGALSHVPRCVLPPGTFDCVASCDVNTTAGAGLRWEVLAVGPHRITSPIAYGSYPADDSPLVPPGSDPETRRNLILAGMREVVKIILTLPLRLAETRERVIPRALAFDGGYETETVDLGVKTLARTVRLHGMQLMMCRGFNWKNYRKFRKTADFEEREFSVRDHVYSGVAIVRKNGHAYARKYLGIQVDYWREISQVGFRRDPLTPGSCCMYGDAPGPHRRFALELTYEQLVRTYRDEQTRRLAWEWNNERPGHNHHGDTNVICLAVAAWLGLYKAVSPRLSFSTVKGNGKKADWLTAADAADWRATAKKLAAKKAVRRALPRKGKPSIFRKIRRPGVR